MNALTQINLARIGRILTLLLACVLTFGQADFVVGLKAPPVSEESPLEKSTEDFCKKEASQREERAPYPRFIRTSYQPQVGPNHVKLTRSDPGRPSFRHGDLLSPIRV